MQYLDIVFIDGLYRDLTSQYGSFLNYLFSCAAIIEKYNYKFKIININLGFKDIEDIVKQLHFYNCHIIGITTNANNIWNVKNFCKKIKSINKDLIIILGGPQVTFEDEVKLLDIDCDVIIKHDGEYKLISLLDFYIKKIGDLKTIEGIIYKADNQVFKNAVGKMWIDVNDLPTPKYDIVKDEKYWLIPTKVSRDERDIFFQEVKRLNSFFMTSRGCPYNCIFCVEGILKSNYRERKPELVQKDLEHFIEIFNPKVIALSDSTFTSSKKKVIEICNIFRSIRKKHNIVWYAEGRVNILHDNLQLLQIMKDSGMAYLQIGIETGSEKIMETINKQISKKQILSVAKKVGDIGGIMLYGNIIIGLPNETEQTIHESISFVKEIYKLTNFNALITTTYLVPFVGTPISRHLYQYGLSLIYEHFEDLQMGGFEMPICKPTSMPDNVFYNFKLLFDKEINLYLKHEIYASPKEEIDINLKFSVEMTKEGIDAFSPWYSVLFSNILFQKFYLSQDRNDTFTDLENLEENINKVFPTRLWELEYSREIHGFLFTSMSGQSIHLVNNHRLYWELASGKLTIYNIALIACNLLHRELSSTVDDCIRFYKQMNLSFALLFKKLPNT